jgi:hypothetical protein
MELTLSQLNANQVQVTCFTVAMLLRAMGQAEQSIAYLRRVVVLEKQVRHPHYAQNAAKLAR